MTDLTLTRDWAASLSLRTRLPAQFSRMQSVFDRCPSPSFMNALHTCDDGRVRVLPTTSTFSS